MYNWESSAKANRKKVKKTGTVVFHPDESVELGFDRLLKEVSVSSLHHNANDEESKESMVRSALMTENTVNTLKNTMHFESLLPCQAQCYRGIFNRRDVILHSRTGSGKTLAYALPLVERHLLLEAKGGDAKKEEEGPFLLIFVFSNDLAVQTKGVLSTIYPKLRVGVAGCDSTTDHEVYDILIGTVRKLDECIRGHKVAAAATALEEKEKAENARLLTVRGGGGGKGVRGKVGVKRGRETEDADGDVANAESDDDSEDDTNEVKVAGGDVKVANVRTIVIDEVDTTLGPRFSNVGRRMKNLLKFVRKANGSLTEGLLSDFRAHHYVLCGATIPNWVVKAGFLGVKKYYYQLVGVGTEKLPERLTCYELNCPMKKRVDVATALLTGTQWEQLGRVVVFGTNKEVASLGAALEAHRSVSATVASPDKKKKRGEANAGKHTGSNGVVFRVLTPSRDQNERIAATLEFNKGVASVLLCTDIAARGLDFTAVDTVLMLSVPHGNMAAETFVHRAGRTARVNREGQCILLSDVSEADVVDMIVKSAHVVFKKYLHHPLSANTTAASGEESSAEKTHYQLTVKNQLRFSRPDVTVPTAREVLEKSFATAGDETLKAAVLKEAKEAGGSTEVIHFSVPASVAHEVRQRLWKYNLKEMRQ